MDGSPQDWLERRGPKMALMACIDDPGGNVAALSHEYEGRLPAFDLFQRYCEQYGLPCSVYLDWHTTYKPNTRLTLQEELMGRRIPEPVSATKGERTMKIKILDFSLSATVYMPFNMIAALILILFHSIPS